MQPLCTSEGDLSICSEQNGHLSSRGRVCVRLDASPGADTFGCMGLWELRGSSRQPHTPISTACSSLHDRHVADATHCCILGPFNYNPHQNRCDQEAEVSKTWAEALPALGTGWHRAPAQEALLRLGARAVLRLLAVKCEGLGVPVAAQPALEPLQACAHPLSIL